MSARLNYVTREDDWPLGVWRTARKPHRCHACGHTVQPGDRYFDTAEIIEPPFLTLRYCRTCALVAL